MKIYKVNMPKKLGLISGRNYFFYETEGGYTLPVSKKRRLYIGFPKVIVENNPNLYTLVKDDKDEKENLDNR